MILDAQTRFSDSQAVTASAVGTNVYDMGVARSIGNGEPMSVVWSVIVAADVGDGDEDFTFEVEYATNAAQSTGRQNIGRRVFESTPGAPSQDSALLVVGFKIVIPLPPTKNSEAGQFIGIRYVTAGTGPTITCDCDLIPSSFVDATNDYANNYDIV